MLSKDDDATAVRSAELTFRTRIKIPCSPRLWCGLLLWEAGIMTRVTQTIYNPDRAGLWLVTWCSPGLWLASQAPSSPQQTVFRINHHPNTKIYLQRKIETSLLKYMNEEKNISWSSSIFGILSGVKYPAKVVVSSFKEERRSCICSVQELKLAEFPFLLIYEFLHALHLCQGRNGTTTANGFQSTMLWGKL